MSPWALIAAALLMGAALLATVWTTHRGVAAASETLERGQAGVIQDALRVQLAGLDALPTRADLEEILAELEPDGLTYVATFDREGRLLASAGEPVGNPNAIESGLADGRVRTPIAIGDRRRMALRRPMGRRLRRAAADSGQTWPRRGGRAGPMVLEFEPRVAADLRAAAGQTLAVGALAAGGLLLVSMALFRWILHREALERRLEHERRLASLGQMSAVLAHEIRNPLASLKGNAQLLARALPEGERTRGKADRVVGEAIRLERLTNGLLEFARTGAIHREPTDPAALLREAAAAVGEERVAIEEVNVPAAWPLDRARMRQVLTNLLENAVQAGDPVEVRVAGERGQLVYVVRDHGTGIAEEDLPRIFEPFFSRRVQGTGLGLAVARRLVELHGGTIAARNAPGGGAEFSLTLPQA
ncbi:MAG TPA: ATP-binding protein [Kofleriaceae bacterium]|nr:ATP-binding protein [Kofleriaceae bacterium]